MRRRLEPVYWGTQLSWEGCLEQIAFLSRMPSSWLLTELTLLALKRQIHLHLGRQPDALGQLALMESHYATILWYQKRDAESLSLVQRSLAMFGDTFPGDPFHHGVLNLVAVQLNRATGKSNAGLNLYERWLPRLRVDAYQIVPLCDMALFVAGQKRFAERDALVDQARRLLETSPAAMPYHHDYFGTTYAYILRSAGKPVEAMKYLPRIGDEATASRGTLTTWAETLIEAGDRKTATRYLNYAARDLRRYPNPQAQKEWDALTRQL